MLCVSDYLGCFVHSQPRSLFLMQQVISLNTIIMVIDDPTIITMFTFSFVIIFTSFTILFSVEIKRGGSRLSNSSVIVAHDCINGSAYSRELVALSCPCLSWRWCWGWCWCWGWDARCRQWATLQAFKASWWRQVFKLEHPNILTEEPPTLNFELLASYLSLLQTACVCLATTSPIEFHTKRSAAFPKL